MANDDEPLMMSLTRALWILSEVHTRDDDLAGYVIMAGARPDYNRDEYIEAWASVRHAIGKVSAAPSPAAPSTPAHAPDQ